MTSIAEHEQHPVQHGPPRPPGGLRRLLYPGFLRAAWMAPLFFGIGCGIVVALPLVGRLAPDLVRRDHRARRRAHRRPGRLPRGDRRLRLLGALRDRVADGARGSLRTRRVQLEGLLPRQHRPQGDRDAVPGDDDLLLPRRRPPRDARAGGAREAGDAVLRQPDVQRPLLGPRLADDLPVRHPGVRGAGELRRSADAGRTRHGVPAAERALVLAAADRRDHDAVELRSLPAERSQRAGRATRPFRSTSPWGRSSSTWASSGRARARS